jgi:hypothetical protein
MHGSSYRGKCDGLLSDLAGVIKETFDHQTPDACTLKRGEQAGITKFPFSEATPD